jgi:hypothetical protein
MPSQTGQFAKNRMFSDFVSNCAENIVNLLELTTEIKRTELRASPL